MEKCKNCGNEFEGEFCPKCGTPVNRQENASVQENAQKVKVRCANCGAELEEGAVFCPKCGSRTNNYMNMSGVATIEDMYLADHVMGRHFIYRIGGAVALLIAIVMSLAYVLPTVLSGSGGFSSMIIIFAIYLAGALIYDIAIIVMSALSIKKGMPRKTFSGAARGCAAFAIIGVIFFVGFYALMADSFGVSRSEAVAVLICALLASIIGTVLLLVGIGGKYDFKKPVLSAKQKNISYVVTAVSLVLCVILALIPLFASGGGANLSKAEEIEIGMSQSEVRNIMGEPDKGDDESVSWEYYSGEYGKLYREYKELEDSEDWSDMEKMLELEEEMEDTPHDTVIITFDSDKKVDKVEFVPENASENHSIYANESTAELITDDRDIVKISYEYYAVFTDGGWEKGVESARYTSISLNTSNWTFSVECEFYIGQTRLEEDNFSGTLSSLESTYNENFARQVLYEYDHNFARKELGNADSEVLSEYRSLLNQYDLTMSWTAQ